MSSAICFNLDQSKILSSGNMLTLYPIIQTFNDSEKEAFRKHCGKRRKCCLTSIFSFSHNVFYSSHNKVKFLSHIYFVICKVFQILMLCKELSPFCHSMYFFVTRKVQTDSILPVGVLYIFVRFLGKS